MISKKLKRLPVLKGNKVVGMVTRQNVVKAFDMMEQTEGKIKPSVN